MTRLDGNRILETSWELLLRDERDFVLAAKASQGAAIFVDVGGKRGLTVAEEICLEELCGPQYAAKIAAAVLLEPGSARRLDGNMCILAKEAKAIRFTGSTAISIKKFLCSPMLGKRPKLVRIGSAAALAEESMAAAVEQAAARLADLERKAAFFDAAVVGDPLALGRAMAAPSGDPVREGMIARSLLNESAIRQQRFAESLEERSMLAAQHELELSAALELSVEAGGAGLLGEDPAGEDLAGEDLAGGNLAGEDLARTWREGTWRGPCRSSRRTCPRGPCSSAAKYEAARRGPREEDAHLRRGHRARPTHRGFCEGRGGIKLAT